MIMIIFYSTKKAKVNSSSRSISLCPQNIINKYNMYMEMHIKWVIFYFFPLFLCPGGGGGGCCVTSNSSITASKYFLLYFELLFFIKKKKILLKKNQNMYFYKFWSSHFSQNLKFLPNLRQNVIMWLFKWNLGNSELSQ